MLKNIPVVRLLIAPLASLFWAGNARADFIYLSNDNTNSINKVSSTGVVTQLASGLNEPESVAVDSNGNVFVPNFPVGTISKITPAGVVTQFASGLKQPSGETIDSSDNLYVISVMDQLIHKYTPAGVGGVIASTISPEDLAYYGGYIYVDNADGTIDKFTTAGTGFKQVASGLTYSTGMTFDGNGNLFVANYTYGTIKEISPTGVVSLFASGLTGPSSLGFDGSGNLYYSSSSSRLLSTLRKIAPDGTDSQVVGSDAGGALFVQQTPEPSSLALVLLGGMGLLGRRSHARKG